MAAERERVVAPLGTLRAYETSVCSYWQSRSGERHRGPWSARTGEPALIVNDRFDPATPIWSAQRVNALLPGSRLPVNEGWGHVVTQQSTCVAQAVSRYLVDGALPAPGATCRPDTVPFS
ncbi:alpha/beta hydrolase [Nonomuraea sp. GTA35]|uniref:alpha/beta hydrolase n=1 Tax=Nonomuraea sp. GTA35 TaxID=1676746 RepID=UPI0035C164E8